MAKDTAKTDSDKNTVQFYTREDSSESEILLKFELPQDVFAKSYETLIKQELKDTKLKGFRKGHAPTKLVEEKLKPMVLMETFQRIAPYYVNSAIIKENISPIASPEYKDLGEIELDKPVKFSVIVTIMPKFTLGDMKKIKVEDKPSKPTKEEIDNTINTMFENNKTTIKSEKIDDAWASEIGKFYKFEDVKKLDDLKKVVSDAIEGQKKSIIERESVSSVVTQAIELSKIVIPEAAIHFEAHEREHMFERDVKEMKMSVEEFCKRQGVTIEDLRARWHKDAQEALESDVLFKLYAAEKNIDVDAEQLKAEIEKIKVSAKAKNPKNFDESAYEDLAWQANIKNYLVKQKAYDQFLKEVLGEKEKASPKADDSKKPTSKKNK